jgi:pimeloyl-ACP methyl ester carboxylesterase
MTTPQHPREPSTHSWTGATGLSLVGEEWAGDRTLVVLQHGGGQTRHAWKGTGDALAAAGHHVVAFDARGHGDSDWTPDGDYSHTAMARDLAAVLAAVDKGRPVLVGASMGGLTSLTAIADGHVDAVALVLVDVAPHLDPGGVERVVAFMSQRPDGFASLAEAAEAIADYQPHRPRPRRLDGLAKNLRVKSDGRYHWHWDPAFLRSADDVVRSRSVLEDRARRVTAPTLLVRGALSDVLTEAAAREFLRLCPGAAYADVADAAHMVAGDRNDVFSAALLDFLEKRVA